jgi:iron(III) transport system ATP-binding protein
MDHGRDIQTVDGPTAHSGALGGAESVEFGVQVSGLRKAFGNGVPVVSDLHLDLVQGTFTALLGESGCGKTTTLRMIAGLERPDAGEVHILGAKVFSASEKINVVPNKRRIGFVFQSYALWPHMSVIDNVAYPLRRAKMRKEQALARAIETLDMLHCADLAERYPGELSGGQQQRIALGRVLADRGNRVVLFDEPLSNLDARLREELRFELRALQEELRFTALYVTHDQAEAMSMSDRVVVMRSGRIERDGSPREVFRQPRTHYVAHFLGGYNILRVRSAEQLDDQVEVETGLGHLRVLREDSSTVVAKGTEIAIPIESVHVTTDPVSASTSAGTVVGAAYYGNHHEIRLELPGGETIRAHAEPEQEFRRSQQLYVRVDRPAVPISQAEE